MADKEEQHVKDEMINAIDENDENDVQRIINRYGMSILFISNSAEER